MRTLALPVLLITITLASDQHMFPKALKDLADYYHEISPTDYYPAELRKELERQGVADSTYIIYISDNGRPFPRCRTRLYDSGIRMPFVVCGPKVARDARSESLVSVIDIGPTVLELAGVNTAQKTKSARDNNAHSQLTLP